MQPEVSARSECLPRMLLSWEAVHSKSLSLYMYMGGGGGGGGGGTPHVTNFPYNRYSFKIISYKNSWAPESNCRAVNYSWVRPQIPITLCSVDYLTGASAMVINHHCVHVLPI